MKTPVSYYGGKQNMLQHLLPLVPPHQVYTESFSGGAALYWAKQPAKVEVINDLNREVVNFYQAVKQNFQQLNTQIQATLHSRSIYEDAKVVYERPHLFDPITRARAFWVLTKQGFATKIGSRGYDKTSGSVERKVENSKQRFTEALLKRLENTQIECNDALKVIQSRDTKVSFHYVDPPYFNSDCGHYQGYQEKDFEALLKVLSQIE